jgi:Tfp pilus assembly pilus retraction ATPase PilT
MKFKFKDEEITSEFKWKDLKPEEILDWYFPIGCPLAGQVVVENEFIMLDELPHFVKFMELLMAEVEVNDGKDDFNFAVSVGTENHKYRAHRQGSIEGPYVVLRQMPLVLPRIEDLGLPSAMKMILLHENLNRGGLVVICGEPGNGKSTTTAAVIRARLEMFGGFCLTLENPIEMPLHGRHGKGFCLQSSVEAGSFEQALSDAMRCYPTATNAILYLGEVRSAETALEALRIANNGHLVITTLHSSNPLTAIKRIVSLATSKSMDSDEGRNLLASSLRFIMHQKLEVVDGKKRMREPSFLFSANNQSPVANRIRGGGIDNLTTEVEQQNQMLKLNQVAKMMYDWRTSSLFG